MPDPQTLSQFYRFEGYAGPIYRSPRPVWEDRNRMTNRLLARVEAICGRKGSLLDVGCSTGFLLSIAKARGWVSTGLELDPVTASVARRNSGADVLVAPGLDQLSKSSCFDLIVMSHWLEHTVEPADALHLAHEHLAPDGLLLVRLPDRSSRVARRTGACWSWYNPPIHLSYFDRRSLINLTRRSGFQEVQVWNQRGDALLFPFEIMISAFKRLKRSGPSPTDPTPALAYGGYMWESLLKLLAAASSMVDTKSGLVPFRAAEDPELVALLQVAS